MSRLLGGLFTSGVVFWGLPLAGQDLSNLGFSGFYLWVVLATSLASIISYLLVTPPSWLSKFR